MNKLLKSKRGMFFTLMAMLLIGLITLSLTSPPRNVTGIERVDTQVTRIKVLNDLVQSLETIHIPTIIRTTTFKTLKEDVVEAPTLPVDLNTDLDSLQARLELNLDRLSTDPDYATQKKKAFRYWFNELKEKIDEIYHADLELVSFDFKTITQDVDAPFSVNINFILEYRLTSEDYPTWNKVGEPYNKNRQIDVNIVGLQDPDPVNGDLIIPSETATPAGAEYFVDTNHADSKTILDKLTQSLGTPGDRDTNKICSKNINGACTPS